jgi:hypothetical protein
MDNTNNRGIEIQPNKIIEAGRKIHNVAAAQITGLIVAFISPFIVYIIYHSDPSILNNLTEILSVYIVVLVLIFSYNILNLVSAGDALIKSVVYKKEKLNNETVNEIQNTIIIKMNDNKCLIVFLDLSTKKSWYDIVKTNTDYNSKNELIKNLPSLEELYFIYENKINYPDFLQTLYWSNTEIDNFKALAFNFENGNIITIDKSNKLNYFLLNYSFGISGATQ